MNSTRLILIFLIITCKSFFCFDFGEYKKNILIIHSYHQNFEWTDQLNNGLLDILKPIENEYYIQTEYLDFKRYQKEAIYESVFNLMNTKYGDTKFDLVITSDDAAFNFIKKYNNVYFKNTPKVFCGVNNYNDSLVENISNISGVAEYNDIKSTIELIKKIHPERNELFIIRDTTFTTLELMKVFYKEIKNNNYSLSIKELVSKNNIGLKKEIDLGNNDKSVVIILGYFLDDLGRFDSYAIRLKKLSDQIDVPIYAVWDFYLNNGIVGGILTSGYDQGKAAAKISKKILEGKSASDIPVIYGIDNQYKFDFKYLEKFRIPKSKLPEGSIILNEPHKDYVFDGETVFAIVVLFFALILIVIILIIYSLNKKKTEKKLLLAKETAENASKLKTEFLAQMSHEIRTPVNTILSFSALIKSSLINSIDGDLKSCFSSIENGGKRLIRTIDLIIKMAEVQSGAIEIDKKIVELYSDILLPVVDEFKVLAKEKNLKIIIEKKLDKTCECNLDLHSMKQIIVNLLDNAIKYTHDGEIVITLTENNSFCKLSIADTGIGISEKYLETIFEPFTQEEQGYTRRYEGNGLGMALVKRYCELNGVEIGIESEKGKGTQVSLTFEKSGSSQFTINL